MSQQDIQCINQELLRLDQHHDADAKLLDIDHLRDILTTDYNQDLKIGYHEGHAIINDVIELENNYTEANFDEWRQHWIDTYRAASSAPCRTVHFDKTAKTTSAH